jgi:hypothetical protein
MTNKQIKDFYLSLIDNEETIWTKEEKHYDTIKWTLFNCRIGDISIESIPGYKLVFTHHNDGKSWLSTRSDAVSFSDIGISKFRLLFPYFGIASRIKRRITTDRNNKGKIESTQKLKSVSEVLSKDKAFARDLKLKQLDIE